MSVSHKRFNDHLFNALCVLNEEIIWKDFTSFDVECHNLHPSVVILSMP